MKTSKYSGPGDLKDCPLCAGWCISAMRQGVENCQWGRPRNLLNQFAELTQQGAQIVSAKKGLYSKELNSHRRHVAREYPPQRLHLHQRQHARLLVSRHLAGPHAKEKWDATLLAENFQKFTKQPVVQKLSTNCSSYDQRLQLFQSMLRPQLGCNQGALCFQKHLHYVAVRGSTSRRASKGSMPTKCLRFVDH